MGRKVVGTAFAGDDVSAGGSAETAGTDLSTTSAGVVTIAVVGTSLGLPVPSAGVIPPPAMSTVVVKLRLKKSGMKKPSMSVQLLVHNVYSVLSTCLMICLILLC
jgi:hypothetical protein